MKFQVLLRTVACLCPQTVMEKFRDSLFAGAIAAYMRSLGVGVFTTRTVGELLWGYEDILLKTAQKFEPQLDDVFGLFYKVSFEHTCWFYSCSEVCINIPPLLRCSHRPTRPTTASTSSSPVNQTTETLPEWTRGTVTGNLLPGGRLRLRLKPVPP